MLAGTEFGAALMLGACAGTETISRPVPSARSGGAAVPCVSSDLVLNVRVPDDERAAAGFIVVDINAAHASGCTIEGYPKVTFWQDSDGTPLGDPAEQQPGTAESFRVTPDRALSVALQLRDMSAFGSDCEPMHVSGLSITPPGGHGNQFVEYPATVCTNLDTPMLKVWPVGVSLDDIQQKAR